MPESFANVIMLWVNVVINGIRVRAFVDSGAQVTIMNNVCAERCGLMRLVDTRYQGVAVGVGTQKIIGRVHMFQIQIAGDFLPVSFSILQDQYMELLIGLDMLKRHQCCIDLRNNVLVVGTTGAGLPAVDAYCTGRGGHCFSKHIFRKTLTSLLLMHFTIVAILSSSMRLCYPSTNLCLP
jgi:hypothetical protein